MKYAQKTYRITALISTVIIILSSCSHLPIAPKGVTLKSLKDYSIVDFNLSQDVKYFDINNYKVISKGQQFALMNITGYPYDFYKDRKAYNALTHAEKKAFQGALPNIISHDYFGDLRYGPTMLNANAISSVANLRYIDNNLNAKTIASKREVLEWLGKIDTPAEIQLVLWMNKKAPANVYYKEGHHYVFTSRIANRTMGEYLGCGLHIYRGEMGIKGDIQRYELIEYKAYEPSAPLSGCGDAP